MYELVGYLASALIVVSLLMSSVLKLRVVNLVGSLTFTVYGLLIGAVPIVVANGAIVVINLVHLRRLLGDRARGDHVEVVEVAPDAPLLDRFVAFHRDDARRFQPDFEAVPDGAVALFVLRDAVPIGVVVAEVDDDEAHVLLDHVTAEHRDLTPGRFVWQESTALRSRGVRRVTTAGGSADHQRYLAAVGFTRDETGLWSRAT